MPLCCLDMSVGARVVAVVGLVVGSVVVTQLATELARGTGDGGVAVLLGLSLDELDSRQRHAPHSHSDHHEHSGPLGPFGSFGSFGSFESYGTIGPRPEPEPFDAYVREVFFGFLTFAVLYTASSVVLAYSTIVRLQWGALPWLLLHALSIASQVARLVVQVALYKHLVGLPDGHMKHHHPMLAHPNHAPVVDGQLSSEEIWEEHIREHQHDHVVETQHAAVVWILVGTVYLMASAYAWLVVLVAHREWAADCKNHRAHYCLGDEGFSLSMDNLASKEMLTSTPVPNRD